MDDSTMFGHCHRCDKWVPRNEMLGSNLILQTGEASGPGKTRVVRFRFCEKCHAEHVAFAISAAASLPKGGAVVSEEVSMLRVFGRKAKQVLGEVQFPSTKEQMDAMEAELSVFDGRSVVWNESDMTTFARVKFVEEMASRCDYVDEVDDSQAAMLGFYKEER